MELLLLCRNAWKGRQWCFLGGPRMLLGQKGVRAGEDDLLLPLSFNYWAVCVKLFTVNVWFTPSVVLISKP
jgi:hypothetical protein